MYVDIANNKVTFNSKADFDQRIDVFFDNKDHLANINAVVINYSKTVIKEYKFNELTGRFDKKNSWSDWLIKILTLNISGGGNTKKIQKSFDQGCDSKLRKSYYIYGSTNSFSELIKYWGERLSLNIRKSICYAKNHYDMPYATSLLCHENLGIFNFLYLLAKSPCPQYTAEALIDLKKEKIITIEEKGLNRVVVYYHYVILLLLESSENPNEIVQSLIQLHRGNFLTIQTMNIISNSKDPKQTLKLFTALGRENILTDQTMEIVKNAKYPDELVKALIILSKINCLNHQYINFLEDSKYPYTLALFFEFLKPTFRHLCFKFKDKHSYTMDFVLDQLFHHDFFMKIKGEYTKDEIFLKRVIMFAATIWTADPNTMIESLSKLKTKDIITLETVITTANAKCPNDMVDQLVTLKIFDLLTPENIMAFNYEENLFGMGRALRKLQHAEALTPYNRILLICSTNFLDMAEEIINNKETRLVNSQFLPKSIKTKDLEYLSNNQSSEQVETALLALMKNNIGDNSSEKKLINYLNVEMAIRVMGILNKAKFKGEFETAFKKFMDVRNTKILQIKTMNENAPKGFKLGIKQQISEVPIRLLSIKPDLAVIQH